MFCIVNKKEKEILKKITREQEIEKLKQRGYSQISERIFVTCYASWQSFFELNDNLNLEFIFELKKDDIKKIISSGGKTYLENSEDVKALEELLESTLKEIEDLEEKLGIKSQERVVVLRGEKGVILE